MILLFLIFLNILVAFFSWFFQLSFFDNLFIPILVLPVLINLILLFYFKKRTKEHIFSLIIFYILLIFLFLNAEKLNIMGNSWI